MIRSKTCGPAKTIIMKKPKGKGSETRQKQGSRPPALTLSKGRQQGRKKMFAGDRTGGEQEFTGDRSIVSCDLSPGFLVKVKYPLGIVVKLPT
jgi:hypothetical protein